LILGYQKENGMTRITFFVACVGVLCLNATRASADPVTITRGSIVLSEPSMFQAGSIAIGGTQGFAIEGRVNSGEGRIDPLGQCFPCEPTADFSVGANLGTFAIRGKATLNGETYTDINSFSSNNFVFLVLIGTTVLPPVNGSSLVLRAPFRVAAESFFTYEGSDLPDLTTVSLAGRGTATVSFHASPSVPAWEFSQMRYEFVPTPEPATLVLVGGGIAATLLRARTRRRTSSPCDPPSTL
jgi:hypothetical protein